MGARSDLAKRVWKVFARVFPRCGIISQAIAFNLFLAFFPTLLLAAGFGSSWLGRKTELLEAIREVNRGGSPMTTHIARKVTQSFQRAGPSSQPTENLSEREQEVLDCLSQGFLYKEIAEKLGISYETVHTYIRRIYEKLQVRTRTEAVAKFLKR